jgi:hypothetical protein
MSVCAGLLGVLLALPSAPEAARPPPVSFLLRDRQASIAPTRFGTTHTGGGLIDVAQPSPDVLVVTLTGVAVAADHPCGSAATLIFELEQCFDVVFDDPKVKAAKLTVEARVIGLLRSGKKGAASEGGASATVAHGAAGLLTLTLPERSVGGGEALSVNDRAGPCVVPVVPGAYTLHEAWRMTATHEKALFGKSATAEFAPDPALDPKWIGPKEPFHGVPKKDLGFQVILRLADEPAAETAKEPR